MSNILHIFQLSPQDRRKIQLQIVNILFLKNDTPSPKNHICNRSRGLNVYIKRTFSLQDAK